MARRRKVVLGMSGGVDSSVAALLLVEQDYDVQGVTLQVWEEEDDTRTTKRWQERGCCKVGLAKHVARLLGIPHRVVDARETFQRGVIEDFIDGYLYGTTPNPCVRCNERVKFGKLFEFAREQQADFCATGHYARIVKGVDGDYQLHKGVDAKKDQSYFLYRIVPDWLSAILFPLGELHKTEVWKHAERLGLPTDEMQESQEICFVTQGNYRTFLEIEAPEAKKPGVFVDSTGRVLGHHEGIAFYTPGQRKGLGIATGERLYVRNVVPDTNTVVVGSYEDSLSSACEVQDLNLFHPDALSHGLPIQAKIRSASPPVAALVERRGTRVTVTFEQPQFAISPGQSAVFYRGDRVLGGGIIARAERQPECDQHPAVVTAHRS